MSNRRYSRAECNEKLLQIQLGVLRERDLDPERRLEVVHVHVERGEGIVILAAEIVVRLAEAVLVHGRRAIRAEQHRLLRTVHLLDGDVHLGEYGARDGELGIDVSFRRRILEVDRPVVTILLLAQIKCKLIVDSQVI